MTVACGQYRLALGVALAVVAVKLWSAAAVVRLLDRQGRPLDQQGRPLDQQGRPLDRQGRA